MTSCPKCQPSSLTVHGEEKLRKEITRLQAENERLRENLLWAATMAQQSILGAAINNRAEKILAALKEQDDDTG